jgi:hypothetical protein
MHDVKQRNGGLFMCEHGLFYDGDSTLPERCEMEMVRERIADMQAEQERAATRFNFWKRFVEWVREVIK